jgi:hypothetical protein
MSHTAYAVGYDLPPFGLAGLCPAESPLHGGDRPRFFDPVNRLWFSEA